MYIKAFDDAGTETYLEIWNMPQETMLQLHGVYWSQLIESYAQGLKKRGNRLKNQDRPEKVEAPEGAASWSTPSNSAKKKPPRRLNRWQQQAGAYERLQRMKAKVKGWTEEK